MESTVGNAEKSLGLGVVGILVIALKKSKCRHEVALLQEVVGVWQPQFLLLLRVTKTDMLGQVSRKFERV